MIPKIKEFENTKEGLLDAISYYKAISSKLSEMQETLPTLWYEVHLCINTFNPKHTVMINTGSVKHKDKKLEDLQNGE